MIIVFTTTVLDFTWFWWFNVIWSLSQTRQVLHVFSDDLPSFGRVGLFANSTFPLLFMQPDTSTETFIYNLHGTLEAIQTPFIDWSIEMVSNFQSFPNL